MEQCSDCPSCQKLTSIVQKLHARFTVYKKRNVQNDEFLNTFKKQNMLLAALKDELKEKNMSLAESLNKLKCSEVECSALRKTLGREREDNEKRFMTKCKDSEQELHMLRKELETTKTELQAQCVTNAQLIEKLEQGETSKTGLESLFAEEKKRLLEKAADAENVTATYNRRMTHWSSLKNDHRKLIRSILSAVKKWEKTGEAAKLEANLLSDPDESEHEDGDTSPKSTPKKSKAKGTCSTVDTSDDDFEDVATDELPVPLMPGDSLTDYSSLLMETDESVKKELSIAKINLKAISPSKASPKRNSPRSASLRNASPRKVSPRKASLGKKFETLRELKNTLVQAAPDVRHIGCDPVENENIVSPRKANPGKIFENISELKSAHVQTAPDVRHIGCDPVENENVVSARRASPGKIFENIRELKSAHVQTAPDVRHIGCDPVENENIKEVWTQDRCLASIREDFEAPLSPFCDSSFPDSESTSNPMTLVTSQQSHLALCYICDGFVSKCTPCQSIIQELSDFKRSKEGLTSGCESPVREMSVDQEEGGSLFSPPKLQKPNSSDVRDLELPYIEKNSSLNFGDTKSQLIKVDVGIQTMSTSYRRKHVQTQTTKSGSSRTIGCQSDFIRTSEETSINASRLSAHTESTATQTDPPLLSSEESISVKCRLCDNKTVNAVCPMKEFLRTSLTSVIQQSKFVSNHAMMDFLETSLVGLIKQSDFISSCSGVFSGYSSLGSVTLPSFYMQHPGMFVTNPTVPLYGAFNPGWCFPQDDSARRSRLCVPSFKKEKGSRSNYDVSDGKESGRRRTRSRSRSYVRKLNGIEGPEIHSRRVSDSPTRLQSESKLTDSSDSSVEEIEVREGGAKRKLKNCRCSSKDDANPRKKAKELGQIAVRSRRRRSSESSCEDSESRVDTRNSGIIQLSISSSEEKREKPRMESPLPNASEQDDGFAKNDTSLEVAPSPEESRSVSGKRPLVKERNNVRTVKRSPKQRKPPAFSADDPPLLLPALAEKQTLNQDGSQIAVVAEHPPVLLPAVMEKSKDSSPQVTAYRDEPLFAVPTRRPPRANVKKNERNEKNLRTVKSAISFVSGGIFSSSNNMESSSEHSNIESVGNTSINVCSSDVEVDHAVSVSNDNVSITCDLLARESERCRSGSAVTSFSEVVCKSKANSIENESIPRDFKSQLPLQEETSRGKLNGKGGEVEKHRKEFVQSETSKNPTFFPDSKVIQGGQKIRSPVKSAMPDLRKSSALLEDDLCLSEDSDSDVEVSPDNVNKVISESVEEVCPDKLQEVSPDSVKEVSLDSVKEVSLDSVKEVSPDKVKEVSPDKVKEVSPDKVKEVSPDNMEEFSSDDLRVRLEEAEEKGETEDRGEVERDLEIQDSVRQKTNQIADSQDILVTETQAKENGRDVGEGENMDVGVSGRAEADSEDREINNTLGAVQIRRKDLEKSEAVSVEACGKLEACFDGKSYGDDLASSIAKVQDSNLTAVRVPCLGEVGLVEEREEVSVIIHEEESIDVQKESEAHNVIQESGSHSKDLNNLDSRTISALVEVLPDSKVSAQNLVLASNNHMTTGSSIYGPSNCDNGRTAVDAVVPNQPLTRDGFGQSVQISIQENAEFVNDIDVNSVALFDDLEDSGSRDSLVVAEDMLKDEETKGKDGSDTDTSGSVFDSLFADLPESDLNLSGVGDLIASVLPNLPDDIREADSPKMIIDTDEPAKQEEEIVPEKVLSENEPSELTDSQNVSATTSTKRNGEGMGISNDLSVKDVPTFVTDSRNDSEILNEEVPPERSVVTAPKRHVPVVVAPTGPYRTRRAGRDSSNQRISCASVPSSIHKTEKGAETVLDTTVTSVRRLRSRTGAKSPPVPSKKNKIVSKEFISSDSCSESDSEKLVISEEGDDNSSGRISPGDKRSDDSFNRIKNVESQLECTAVTTKARMRTRSSQYDYSLPVKKGRYSTRLSSGSDVSDEASTDRDKNQETKKLLESNETTKNTPPHNLRPRSRQSRRNVSPEPKRRSLRNCSKTTQSSSSEPSSPEESGAPSDGGREVASLTTAPASPKKISKLQKLRKNLSKGHPLFQPAGYRLEPPPLKRVKAGPADEPKSEAGKPKPGASLQMAKSGRTICVLSGDPENLRQRQRPKDPPKTALEFGTPATIFTKPRVTPQERLAALQSSGNTVQTNSKEVTTPNNVSSKTVLVTQVPTSAIRRTVLLGQTAVLEPAQAFSPTLKEEAVRRGNSSPKERQPRGTPTSSETSSTTNAPTFKRSNSIRNLFADRSTKSGPTNNSSTRLRPAGHPDTSPNVPVSGVKESIFSVGTASASVKILPSEANPLSPGHSLPDSSTSSTPVAPPDRPKRSDIWVQPAMEMEMSRLTRWKMRPCNERTLSSAASPINYMRMPVNGHDLIAMIDSTPYGDMPSTNLNLVSKDRHPLLHAWKRRGETVTFWRKEHDVLANGMAESLPAVKKLLNAYLSSPYFTEELLTRTVNSLLNPKYMRVDAIVSRLMVEMVEVDFDSQPCIDTPGPGQFMTKIQQQLIALIMRLFPTYRSIVKDVLLLIEYHAYCFGHAAENGRLSWLAVLHTALCRIMKWRDVSLMFCYDAMYCYVNRFATVLTSVFQVWPQLLPNFIEKKTMGSVFRVMAHFIMTQGEPDKQSDVKTLRAMFMKKKLYSGDTNSSQLTQNIIGDMKDGKCGLISPELILISKREDIPWAQDKVVNQHLLPMVRDWLLNSDHPDCPPLPPAAVLTLCGIVRAFRGPESAVALTHTLMSTLLLDTKAVAALPQVEHAVCAGLVFLSRHNIEFVVDAVKKWHPSNRAPEWLIEILLHLIYLRARGSDWWAKELKDLYEAPFPRFTKLIYDVNSSYFFE